MQERPFDTSRSRGRVRGMHERRPESPAAHRLTRREAVQARRAPVEEHRTRRCGRSLNPSQKEQQRTVPGWTERAVNTTPIGLAPRAGAEHLAVDAMPRV